MIVNGARGAARDRPDRRPRTAPCQGAYYRTACGPYGNPPHCSANVMMATVDGVVVAVVRRVIGLVRRSGWDKACD